MLEGNLQTRLFSSKAQSFLQNFSPDIQKQFQRAFNEKAGGHLNVPAPLVDPHPVPYMLLVLIANFFFWKETII